jgi:magnesium transporter
MDNYLFFTLKSYLINENSQIDIEQISFILGKKYLLTFQEKKGDHFEHIRERLREKIGLVRERSIDYLLFLLLEAMLDNYDLTIKSKISEIENRIKFDSQTDVKPEMMIEIEKFKDELNLLKKSLQPILDSLVKIEKGFTDIIVDDNLKYYMGLRDTCQHLTAEIDFNLQKLESAINMFFSLQNQKMNQIMKTLTIVASIFIPLTFIAGIYGMNFENMPELKWDNGYFFVLGFMLIIIIVLSMFFRFKKWFK